MIKLKIGKCKIKIETKFKKYKKYESLIYEFLTLNKKTIKKELSLPKKIIIDIEAIKGDTCGEALELSKKKSKYKILIDVRKSTDDDLLCGYNDTLIHELIHVSQYVDGSLSVKWNYDNDDWDFYWKGKRTSILNEDCHEEYLNLPWERHANKKTNKMIRKVKI